MEDDYRRDMDHLYPSRSSPAASEPRSGISKFQAAFDKLSPEDRRLVACELNYESQKAASDTFYGPQGGPYNYALEEALLTSQEARDSLRKNGCSSEPLPERVTHGLTDKPRSNDSPGKQR